MNTYKRPKSVEIYYFTGTGGTKKTAGLFAEEFIQSGATVRINELNQKHKCKIEDVDLLLLLYPVYAFNAPMLIYDFIHSLPKSKKRIAAVISVSAGGEVQPNTACRFHCIKRLRSKGYQVVYENMIVLPSNFFVETPDELSVWLLKILPNKVHSMTNEILSRVIRRTNPDLFSRIVSMLGILEQMGSRLIGRFMKVNQECNGCGLCHNSCPMSNIEMYNKKPNFRWDCALCLKCIYQCPKKAICLCVGNFVILKGGYQLNKWENFEYHQLPEASKPNIDRRGLKGIYKYFSE